MSLAFLFIFYLELAVAIGVDREHSTAVLSPDAAPSGFANAQPRPSTHGPGTEDSILTATSMLLGDSTNQPKPNATENTQSALDFQKFSSATDVPVPIEPETVTQQAKPDPSTLLNDGPSSASRLLVDLAPTELSTATDTSGSIPTLETSLGALQQQNGDTSSLPPYAPSTNAPVAKLSQASAVAYPTPTMSGDNTRPEDTSGTNILPTSASVPDTFDNNVVQAVGTQQSQPSEAPGALDVFISALATNVISSLAAENTVIASVFNEIASQSPKETVSVPEPSIRPDMTMSRPQQSNHQTSGPSIPTSSRPISTSQPTRRPSPSLPITSASSTSIATKSPTPSTFSTSTSSSSTSSSALSATSTAAPSAAPAPRLAHASVAGIATGVAAGAVVIGLGAFFLIRRKQQGKAPFTRKSSQRSGRAYPEVAWLYDPAPSPPPESDVQDRHASERSLLNPQGGATEMTSMAPAPGTPELPPAGAESPLLPPVMPAARGRSPGDSPSGSSRRSARSSNGRKSARSSAGSAGRMIPILEEPRG